MSGVRTSTESFICTIAFDLLEMQASTIETGAVVRLGPSGQKKSGRLTQCATQDRGIQNMIDRLLEAVVPSLPFAIGVGVFYYFDPRRKKREAESKAELAGFEADEEAERQKEQERKREKVARALAAFPRHWSTARVLMRPGWDSSRVADLFPPDVIIECDDGSIELYKPTRVRSLEARDKTLKRCRKHMAICIRLRRQIASLEKQECIAREKRLRQRLAAQIRADIEALL